MEKRTLVFSVILIAAASFWVSVCAAQPSRPPLRGSLEPARQLYMAIRRGDKQTVERLVAEGVALDQEYQSSTPLIEAVNAGHQDIVNLILAGRADINARGMNGGDTLGAAAAKGYIDLMDLLIAHGADLQAKDRMGGTPLYDALQSGCIPHWDARWGPFPDNVELLLAHGADVNARNLMGETPLLAVGTHLAYGDKGLQLARLLLGQGADVMARDRNGATLLHRAAQWGNVEAVRLLIDNGADVNARDNNGQTPLAVAKGEWIARLLREHGARNDTR